MVVVVIYSIIDHSIAGSENDEGKKKVFFVYAFESQNIIFNAFSFVKSIWISRSFLRYPIY